MAAQDKDAPSYVVAIPSEAAMITLANGIAPLLHAGDKIALSGPLGAGKSTFARAVIHNLCGRQDVPSPTFTLVQTYDTKTSDQLWHFDFYRLEIPEDAYELAIEEAFENAVCLMEWPEKLGPLLPEDTLWLSIAQTADNGVRQIHFHAPHMWQKRLSPFLDKFKI